MDLNSSEIKYLHVLYYTCDTVQMEGITKEKYNGTQRSAHKRSVHGTQQLLTVNRPFSTQPRRAPSDGLGFRPHDQQKRQRRRGSRTTQAQKTQPHVKCLHALPAAHDL